MILGSRVRTRLLTHFHVLFSLLKNSKSGGDERSYRSRAESPVTNLPGAAAWCLKKFQDITCVIHDVTLLDRENWKRHV